MKDKDFAELKGSLTEALEHARGKVTLIYILTVNGKIEPLK